MGQFKHNNRNHGFFLTFNNEWSVSVQWGSGHYSSNRGFDPPSTMAATAEVAVIDPDGKFSGDVLGWQTPDQVARIIARIASKKVKEAAS